MSAVHLTFDGPMAEIRLDNPAKLNCFTAEMLTQFGAHLETLHPGGQSSQMHWESDEDEFLYMLTGALTVIEDGQPTIIGPGDACVWKAGAPVGHCLKNHTDAPATYIIVGTRQLKNVAYYPGLDLLATEAGFTHLDGTPYPKFEG